MWLFSILNIFHFPFNITLCLLPLKKSLTQFNNCPSKPYLFNFNKSLSYASFHKLGTQPSSNVLSKIFCNGIFTMSAVSRNKRGWHPSGPIDLLVFKFFNCLVKTSILVFKLVTGVVKYPGALLTNGEYSVLFPKLKVVSCRTCLSLSQTWTTLARSNLSPFARCTLGFDRHFYWNYFMRSLLAWLRALHLENID